MPRLDTLLLRCWEENAERPALIDGDTVVTYGDLRQRVLWVAGELRARGVGPGDLVGVYQPRSVAFVVSLLGVVVAGAAHVSFDLDDPAERTADMIADCDPRLLITQPELAARLGVPAAVLTVTGERRSTAAWEPPAGPLADRPVAVLYTSGSTGRPKASLISHAALVSRMTALQDSHRLCPGDRVVHHTAYTFDAFMLEVHWPLLAGAAVVIAAPGRRRDAGYLAALIRDRQVTTFWCVVSLLELFLLAGDGTERYDGLRQVLTGGEPLSREVVTSFQARSTASLTNIYGPSECTIYLTAWVCPRDPVPDTILLGPAIADTTLWILDEQGRPVPEGAVGELYAGGAGLATGYLNRPELTAERFLDDPVRGRLYRTGDLVLRHPGGELEYRGRTDQQVKIRGVRIELGEIESAARGCPGVRQAAAVARGDGPGRRLVAFLVAEPGVVAADLVPAVRAGLRDRLPATMVPSVIEVLDALPLSANGKLDRRALAASTGAEEPVRPATTVTTTDPHEMELLVADVWRTVLEMPEVDRSTDFFDLGGDSYRAMRVVRTLQDVLAVRIPLETLLREPTVETFAVGLIRLAAAQAG